MHLKYIVKKFPAPNYDGSWLGTNPSKAFLISIGAGPWLEQRRFIIQKKAVDWYNSQKISDLYYAKMEKVYPLSWQNQFNISLITHLRNNNLLFSDMCKKWKSENWENVVNELFEVCGTKKCGSKVLWMFARDFLEIPAFPIDRWVRRTLVEFRLPTDSFEMTRLCLKENVNPNVLNRSIFPGKNPDWSKEC
jgi:hypothetical protein